MTIWERITTALATLNLPMALDQFVVEAGEFPNAYLVYFLVDAPPQQWADDRERLRTYKIQVNYFCKTGLLNMPDIDGVMLAAGFTKGNLIPIPRDDSGFYGLGTEYLYQESEE